MPDEVLDGTEALTPLQSRVWRMYHVARKTQDEIAALEGCSQQAVGQALSRARANMPRVDLVAERRAIQETHREVIRRAFELADKAGAPVTAGKDGDVVHDPDDRSVVRDYAGRIAALKLALQASEAMRKLDGMDAATRVDVAAVVKYEIVGVDTEALK
jgi:predicted DNA-binding protein (UPF0251 family)